jgi:hypothetical protein
VRILERLGPDRHDTISMSSTARLVLAP